MRALRFTLTEAVNALSRAGMAGWLAILSLAALAAFGSAVWGARQSLDVMRESLLARFELEAFLLPGREAYLDSVAAWLQQREGVLEVEAITKDEAAERFAERYGDELFDLLAENPLPPSLVVHYNPERVAVEWISREAEEIGNHEHVEDVAYEGQLLARLEELSLQVGFALLGVAALLAMIALFFTVQTIRVAVETGESWAHAVRLVGGTEQQVRNPYIAAGLIAGLIAGLVGAGIVGVVQFLLSGTGLVPPPQYPVLGIVLALTMLAGAFGAKVALKKSKTARKQKRVR